MGLAPYESLFSHSGPCCVHFCGNFTPCSLLQSGLCSSVPLFALPYVSLFGHDTFQDFCCLFELSTIFHFYGKHEKRVLGAWFLSRKGAVTSDVQMIHDCIHRVHYVQQRVKIRESLASFFHHVFVHSPHSLLFATKTNMHDFGQCSLSKGLEIASMITS